MPCDCSHMEPTRYEIEFSKIRYLLDELDSGRHPDAREFARGMHPEVYNKGLDREAGDRMIAELCGLLTAMEERVIATHSLEMQMWWRDHQADDERKAAAKEAEARARRVKAGQLRDEANAIEQSLRDDP